MSTTDKALVGYLGSIHEMDTAPLKRMVSEDGESLRTDDAPAAKSWPTRHLTALTKRGVALIKR